MDEYRYTDEQPVVEPVAPVAVSPQKGMAFLAENPESFGFVTDAFPVATGECLIAAHGRRADPGMISPTYPMGNDGVDGLLDGIFCDLISKNDANRFILNHTFVEDRVQTDHPVARYAAAMAEMVAFGILSEADEDTTLDELSRRLGTEIPRALDGLREAICNDGLTSREAKLYEVSLGICRMQSVGNGNHLLDLFTTGNFNAYLLDANGLRPLQVDKAEDLSPECPNAPLVGKRLRLKHPEPFAILLLSGGASSVNAAEQRSLRESPGLIWHYRMRLEAYILRILTACVREEEFGERANRFFTGRSHGRDSASGSLLVSRGEISYPAFRSNCLARLRHVEDLIALLPDGYDPERVTRLPARAETENTYIRRLLVQERGLVSRVSEALRVLALHKLACLDKPGEVPPLTVDAPEFRRLSFEDIYEAYRLYDVENDADRALLLENQRALRDHFADHWITLRPLLETVTESVEAPSAEAALAREQCERSYELCLSLNARLGDALSERRCKLYRLKGMLADALRILETEENDWLCGRACHEQAVTFGRTLAEEIPVAVSEMLEVREIDTDRYRSLLTAYMTERDRLFACDTVAPHGFFAADWQTILTGTMTEARWADLHASAAEADLTAPEGGRPYSDLMETLHRISRGTGALMTRINARAAAQRMARDLSGRVELQIAAVRASAYEDPDWGPEVAAILDTSHRNNYFGVVRRWQETRELMAKREAAYREYRKLYEN